MKYKVGDKVRLREWDDMAKKYPVVDGVIKMEYSFCVPMKKFCGTTVTIDFVGEGYYEIKEDGRYWCWTDEMFEDVENPKNHWKEIAGWFGLKLYEEFDAYDGLHNPYKFTKDGLVDCNGFICSNFITDIINGNNKITKTPYRPKNYDKFFYISLNGEIINSIFDEYKFFHLILRENKLLFKTRKEAEANRERILKEYEEVLK